MNISILKADSITNNVYYVETKENNYIVKIFKNPTTLLGFIRSELLGRRLRFENEIYFYKNLRNLDFNLFHFPNLIKTDGRRYIIIEYLSGKPGWDKKKISRQHLITALLEFQTSHNKIKRRNILKKMAVKWQTKIPCKILRFSYSLISSPKDIIVALKCNLVALKCNFAQQRNKQHIILHNDLFYFNNMITNDNILYYYDFELAGEENKWYLVDILDLSFDLVTLEIDIELFSEYLNKMKSILYFKNISLNIENQVRIILLRKLMGVIISNKTTEHQKINCKNFILKIILSDINYKKWYLNNIQKNLK